MTFKSLIRWIIGIYILLVVFLVSLWLWYDVPIISTSERQEQAEVIEKRIVFGGEDNNDEYYIVAFRFSDSSEKEFNVGGLRTGEKTSDAMQVGDTGIVTYKERKDIKEKYASTDSWKGRNFKSFEKNLECGGIKVESRGFSGIESTLLGIGGVTLLAFGFIAFLLVYKKMLSS